MRVVELVLNNAIVSTGDSFEWSDDLIFFVERLLNHQLCYKQCAMLSPGIYFAGPKKVYALDEEEERRLQAHGITSKFGWAYRHAIIHGFRFDIPPKILSESLSCNSVFTTTNGGLFFLHTILLIEHRGFLLASKLPSLVNMNPDLDAFSIKVGPMGRRIKAIPVDCVLGYKYHIMLNDSGEISFACKIPNTREVE